MPHFHRYKILLDEGLQPRNKLPRINSRFDVKHIREDFKLGGLPDEKVYKKAVETNRLLIVFNVKDYKSFAKQSKRTGIIGISQNLPVEQIDKKLNSFLSKNKPGNLFGKFNYISGEN